MLLFRLLGWGGIESWGTECVQELDLPHVYPWGWHPKLIVKNMPKATASTYHAYLGLIGKNLWGMVHLPERYEWCNRMVEVVDRLWPDCEIKALFTAPYHGYPIVRPKEVVGKRYWWETFERPKYLLVYEEMFWDARERKADKLGGRLFEQGKYHGDSRYLVRRPPKAMTVEGDDWFHLYRDLRAIPEDGRCRVRVRWRSAAVFIGALVRVGAYTYRLPGKEKVQEERLRKGPR